VGIHDGISTRRVLGMAVAGGRLGPVWWRQYRVSPSVRRTPDQILGPFYPVVKPLYQGSDLTTVRQAGRAAGQVIHVMGRVVNAQGQPVQAAPAWRFGRPIPTGATRTRATPIQRRWIPISRLRGPDHRCGRALPDEDHQAGSVSGKAPDNRMRPPHIHFDVTGKSNRLVTQMYFRGRSP